MTVAVWVSLAGMRTALTPADMLASRVCDVNWNRALKMARAARCVFRSRACKMVNAVRAMIGRRMRR